jgi:hypothetical protein
LVLLEPLQASQQKHPKLKRQPQQNKGVGHGT